MSGIWWRERNAGALVAREWGLRGGEVEGGESGGVAGGGRGGR